MGVRGWNWLVGGVMTPPYGVRSGNRVGGRQIAAPFPTAPVGALFKRPLQNRAAILKISAGKKLGLSKVMPFCVQNCRTANGERPDRRRWREEGGERVAAVGERRWCVSTKDIRRAPQQGVPTGCGGERRAINDRPYSCGSQDRTTPQSATLTAPL